MVFVSSKFIIVSLSFLVGHVWGHGMMLNPTNRGSLWRYDWTQPANYQDNEFFCGGVDNQFLRNSGRCGICGDNFADPRPRANENGGIYGNGIISQTYASGSVIEVEVILTANHEGNFVFSLCALSSPNELEEESCFSVVNLQGGAPKYVVKPADYRVINYLQLPAGLTCERCVLRWTYTAGNSWGICPDGVDAPGCGPQETFRSCADIRIE